MNPGIKEMEAMILECAKLDREINYFVDVVQQTTAEVNRHDVSQSKSSQWEKKPNTSVSLSFLNIKHKRGY